MTSKQCQAENDRLILRKLAFTSVASWVCRKPDRSFFHAPDGLLILEDHASGRKWNGRDIIKLAESIGDDGGS